MPREMKIGGHKIGPGRPCWVAAEYGISWNGDMDVARKLVRVAAEAGCDAVKGQKRDVENYWSAAEMEAPRPGPWGPTFGSLKRLLEMTPAQCVEVRDLAKSLGVPWSASPWDVRSVEVLADLEVEWVKVASASISDLELVAACGSMGCPVIMSTGMSDTGEIDRAVNQLEACGSTYALLHTCSTYPANIADLHLNRIAWLRERYPEASAWGYSGHESGVLPSVEAVRLGANIIERHITLDRTMWGSDQAASLEPGGLRVLVNAIRTWEAYDEDHRADPDSAADALCAAEVAEVTRKLKRNRDAARVSRGESGPRSVLAVEEAVRKKLRRVGA